MAHQWIVEGELSEVVAEQFFFLCELELDRNCVNILAGGVSTEIE